MLHTIGRHFLCLLRKTLQLISEDITNKSYSGRLFLKWGNCWCQQKFQGHPNRIIFVKFNRGLLICTQYLTTRPYLDIKHDFINIDFYHRPTGLFLKQPNHHVNKTFEQSKVVNLQNYFSCNHLSFHSCCEILFPWKL